jgi:chemotaxis protein methyltransferase CheR
MPRAELDIPKIDGKEKWMKDVECVRFLQWALPHLRMKWQGFRKVRRQVCKRVNRRIHQLQLPDVNAYEAYLRTYSSEWDVLDNFCRISISRFLRDKGVFECLGSQIFSALGQMTSACENKTIQCWSAGCASGEEAYTLALIWQFVLAPEYPGIDIHITATDTDQNLLERAERACYPASSIKELPDRWVARAFDWTGIRHCLHPNFREKVKFSLQDIRHAAPEGFFHMILCRNMAFTYFDTSLQQEILERIRDKLVGGGALVIGMHEVLPVQALDFVPWFPHLKIYRKKADGVDR